MHQISLGRKTKTVTVFTTYTGPKKKTPPTPNRKAVLCSSALSSAQMDWVNSFSVGENQNPLRTLLAFCVVRKVCNRHSVLFTIHSHLTTCEEEASLRPKKKHTSVLNVPTPKNRKSSRIFTIHFMVTIFGKFCEAGSTVQKEADWGVGVV